ncbi:MAG TPA: ERAP1-like C-terminal domain-containing protein, partial [Kofleriaceae bacterium]|nr:ERAP1-like C-terminal domain-containing protein [Kofleriaceae bacterium]
AFLDALAAATRPEIAAALASNLGHAGTPVVELALRCAGDPATASVVASARDGVTVPVCVRFPAATPGAGRACLLAGAATEQALPAAAGCPAWLVGNAGGLGYYRTVWRGPAPPLPPGAPPEERLARGDDLAFALRRGELSAAAALAEIAALAGSRDPYDALAALEIARALDRFADPVRRAWTAWLAGRFAGRLTREPLLQPRSIVELVARGQLVALAGGAIGPDIAAAARARLARWPAGERDPAVLAVAAARDAGGLFDAMVRAAAGARDGAARAAALEELGAFPAVFAPRVVELALDPRFSAERVWPAVAAMLGRGETRAAAWRAIRPRFGPLIAALGPAGARDAIAALGGLCDPAARAELAVAAAPELAAIPDGARTIDRALAAIDRCAGRRAVVGDLAAALAASPAPAPRAPRPRPAGRGL